MDNAKAAERAARRQYWKEHVQRWKASGLTQAEYCRQHDLKTPCFWYWRKRLVPESATLVEVPIKGSFSPSFLCPGAPLCLVMAGGLRIEIHKGFDPATLKELIEILSSR